MSKLWFAKYGINRRREIVIERINQLNAAVARCEDQIKRSRLRSAKKILKSRAKRLVKQRRMLEEQRDMLYNQSFDLEEAAITAEAIENTRKTVSDMKSANEELKGMMKKFQDGMKDLMDVRNEVQKSLGMIYNVTGSLVSDSLVEEELNRVFGGASSHHPSTSSGHAVPGPTVKEEVRVKRETAAEIGSTTELNGTEQNPIVI